MFIFAVLKNEGAVLFVGIVIYSILFVIAEW